MIYLYNQFDIIYIVECQNNETVKRRFKEELKVKNLLRMMKINDKMDRELFTLSQNVSIEAIKNILNLLVDKFQINKDYALAELEFKITKEKNIQLEHEMEIEKEK